MSKNDNIRDEQNKGQALSEEKLTQIQDYEGTIFKRYKEATKITSFTFSIFGIEYFLDEGYKLLIEISNECNGENVSEDIHNTNIHRNERLKLLLNTLDKLDFSKLCKRRRDEIISICQSESEKRLFNSLITQIQPTGNFSTSCFADAPVNYSMILNPDKSKDRYKQLKEFKKYLKQELNKNKEDKYICAICNTYLEKINSHIVNTVRDFIIINDKNNREADESQKERRERNLSRLNLYEHGIGNLGPNGDYAPTTIDTVPESRNEINPIQIKDYYTDEYGPNFMVNAEMIKSMFELVLSANGFSKWKVIINPKSTTLSVNGVIRVIKIPSSFYRYFYSIKPTSSILAMIGHEFAHVVQHEIRRQTGINLTRTYATASDGVATEGAAVNEEIYIQNLLGLPRDVNTQYLAAMRERLNGGNYIDCVRAFYTSYLTQYPGSEIIETLKLAINRTRRIFRNSGDMESHLPYVSNSHPLSYLTNITLLDKYGCITPLFKELVDLGIIDFDKIDRLESAIKPVYKVLTRQVIDQFRYQ